MHSYNNTINGGRYIIIIKRARGGSGAGDQHNNQARVLVQHPINGCERA